MRVEDFWGHARPAGDCLEWAGGRGSEGYGRVRIAGVPEYAHRVAYRLSKGPIPDGLTINHHCDNPPCVKPEHLYAGTVLDNVRDRVRRGRGGSAGVRSDVASAILGQRGRADEIAARFGVSRRTVYRIWEGTWRPALRRAA